MVISIELGRLIGLKICFNFLIFNTVTIIQSTVLVWVFFFVARIPNAWADASFEKPDIKPEIDVIVDHHGM